MKILALFTLLALGLAACSGSRDPVERAAHYNLYWDDFFSSSCYLEQSGKPQWCAELAVEVADTTYVHGDPDSRSNYYRITACNGDGCSRVDSENPAGSP